MTKTAHELWNDEVFLKKRIVEQLNYILTIRFSNHSRKFDLMNDAYDIKDRFERRLLELGYFI